MTEVPNFGILTNLRAFINKRTRMDIGITHEFKVSQFIGSDIILGMILYQKKEGIR